MPSMCCGCRGTNGPKATRCFIKKKVETDVKATWRIKRVITDPQGPKKI